MRRLRKRSARQQGTALLIAILVLLIVSSALAVIAASIQLDLLHHRRQERLVRLTASTDAGMAETLAELQADASFPGFEPYEYNGALVETTVQTIGSKLVRIIVSALSEGEERFVEAQVLMEKEGPKVLNWRRLPPG